jgi:hypothetical protein
LELGDALLEKVKRATRFHTVTVEIPQAASGLAAKAYAHVDYDQEGRAVAVRLCEKGKDGSSLDQILTAVGDAITSGLEVIDA